MKSKRLVQLFGLLCLLGLALPTVSAARDYCQSDKKPGGTWRDECRGDWRKCSNGHCETFHLYCEFMIESLFFTEDYFVSCEEVTKCKGKLSLYHGEIVCAP